LKKIFIFLTPIFIGLLLNGCYFFNERGVASTYYNDCGHYYDSRGIFHEKCEENLVNYDEIDIIKSDGNGLYYVEF
jgi:hypothetical protein